jgi:hypothetical protein
MQQVGTTPIAVNVRYDAPIASLCCGGARCGRKLFFKNQHHSSLAASLPDVLPELVAAGRGGSGRAALLRVGRSSVGGCR